MTDEAWSRDMNLPCTKLAKPTVLFGRDKVRNAETPLERAPHKGITTLRHGCMRRHCWYRAVSR